MKSSELSPRRASSDPREVNAWTSKNSQECKLEQMPDSMRMVAPSQFDRVNLFERSMLVLVSCRQTVSTLISERQRNVANSEIVWLQDSVHVWWVDIPFYSTYSRFN